MKALTDTHWQQHRIAALMINAYSVIIKKITKNSLQYTNPDSAHTSNSNHSKTAD
jgi:hypothetical protein